MEDAQSFDYIIGGCVQRADTKPPFLGSYTKIPGSLRRDKMI